jgi:mono/diheme cytochrome c family protein
MSEGNPERSLAGLPDQETELVGALAVYARPDDLIEAVERVQNSGYRRLDTVSPYPIHGIDNLLGKGPSRLGYVAAIAGLTGTAIAKTAQWWTSVIDYPLNIGGNPLFSYPAFVPITFELMVLFAALTTVFGMLVVFNRLPQFGSSLLRSRHIKDLTCDKYGIVVDARDPRFNAEEFRRISSEPSRIGFELLYREKPGRFFSQRVLSPHFLVLLLGVALFSSSATRLVFRYGGEIPPFDFMKRQEKLNPQARHSGFEDGLGMRLPVAGTVARGLLPYEYPDSPEAAGDHLVNPLPLDSDTLARGQRQYSVFCQPCHGREGDGRATLTAAFPRPASLHSNKVRTWSDGRVYAVLEAGQNAMPSYSSQISREDRWQIIHYLRALQRAHNAEESDFQ